MLDLIDGRSNGCESQLNNWNSILTAFEVREDKIHQIVIDFRMRTVYKHLKKLLAKYFQTYVLAHACESKWLTRAHDHLSILLG